MYEARHEPLLPRAVFVKRVALHVAMAVGLLGLSLGIGMLGYVLTEGFSWIDAFLNTAMLLGGMGPVNPPLSFGGKLFAGLLALYAGLVFIVCAALVLTPVVHRVLHHFHVDENPDAG
ncbi:hypothetical protein [Hydrogenophaga sp.]|uniref:hypothetical protein n=1 Tax=Hydrogenophaga sp. TaxID=1904254 RepID=UPI0027227EA4|nr:hypothetical protein [Hydrogenophaga sp.]MDO9435608.1 hypothetical protein [Hydrogenophaga sp.]